MTCNPKLYRKRQSLAKIQSECGVLESLSILDGKLRAEVGQTLNIEVAVNERNIAKRSLTKLANVMGSQLAKFTVMSEIVGSGTSSIPPESDAYLRACGLIRIDLTILNMVNPSNEVPIPRDAILVGATSNATGRLAIPLDGSENKAYIEVITGTFASSELVNVQGSFSGIFTTSGAPVLGGFEYTPRSSDFEYLTIRSEEDGFQKSMRDAMGTFTINAESSTIGKFQFDFTGITDKKAYQVLATGAGVTFAKGDKLHSGSKIIEVLRNYDGDSSTLNTLLYRDLAGVAADTDAYTDGTDSITIAAAPVKAYHGDLPMTEGITYYSTVPPILQDSKTKWGGFEPVFSSLSFDIANEVVPRKNANDHTGFAGVILTARNPGGSINPELVSVSDYDFLESWFDGDLNAMQFRFGDQPGNGVFIYMPQVQAQNVTDQDVEGNAGVSYEYQAKGENDDELAIVFI